MAFRVFRLALPLAGPFFAGPGTLRFVALAGLIGLGLFAYGAAALIFGAARLGDVRGLLKRGT